MTLKIAVAVLSYNRRALLERTLHSLSTPLARTLQGQGLLTLHLVDNGSTDGSEELVAVMGGLCNTDGDRSVGHGMNLAIGEALAAGPDLVLFTADDYRYYPDWLERLLDWWEDAPGDVVLTTCSVEPEYDWNTPRGIIVAGGETGVIRDSVPGSNWSFLAEDVGDIIPVRETTGGEDLEICAALRARGRLLCALDLAEHIGERRSAWGNESWRVGRPFDWKRWGLG